MLYTIAAELKETFEKKLNEITERAIKYGGHVGIVKYSEPYIHPIWIGIDNVEYPILWIDVEADVSYRLGNWEFVASLQWDDALERNLIKSHNNNIEIPKEYLTRCYCDHCNSRRVKKDTFVIRNLDNGELKQVGRGCLKAYIGYSANQYLSFLSCFNTLDEYAEECEHALYTHYQDYSAISVLNTLIRTASEVKHYTYIGSYEAYDEYGNAIKTTTASIVSRFMCNPEMDTIGDHKKYTITNEDIENAASVLEWINNLNAKDFKESKWDYIHNIKSLCKGEYISRKNVGLLVSAYGFYLREKAKLNKVIKYADSVHVGKVGDKIELKSVILEKMASYITDFGYAYLYRFVSDKNVFIWKTSKCYEDGITVNLKGTIKDHNEFNRVKQTILTRCKLQEI